MNTTLLEFRNDIHKIDQNILELLTHRMQISKKIALYKKENDLPIFDPIREQELLEEYSKDMDFDICRIYQAIMDESKKIQEKVISE